MLDIDGFFSCYTEEPPRRAGKPYCIPAGLYQGKMLYSVHFQRLTPHILDVPGFEDIEIHPGNAPRDTHGCTLVGETRGTDFVGNSVLAFNTLVAQLPQEFEVEYKDSEGTT